jgi:MFS family permease
VPAPGAALPPGRRGSIPHDVWAISITSLFSDWSYEMLLPVLPFFLALDLGASPLVVGLVEGAAIFAQSMVQFVSGGRLAHRADRRSVGAAGYATMTAAHGLLAVATAWPYAAALRVIAWGARGERQPIKKAILSDAARSIGAGRSFGLEQTFDSMGAIGGTLSAAYIVLNDGVGGFRSIFALSVIPGIVAVFLFYRYVRDRPEVSRRPLQGPIRTNAPFPLPFRWYLVASGVFGLAFFNILLGLLRVGTALTGAPGAGTVGAIVISLFAYLLYNLVYTGMSFPAGVLADRFPRVGLVALSYLLFVPVDILFITAPGVFGAFLAFLVAGIQIALLDVAESAWISRAVPSQEVGRAFGWFGGVRGGASLVGSVALGAIWTTYSAPPAFLVSAVLAVAATFLLIPVARAGAQEPASSNRAE